MSSSLFTPSRPTPSQPVVPATPRLQSYTAYEKNEFKVTLTPQPSAQQPGLVNILARFTVLGSNDASGINFQAAVPKVNFHNFHRSVTCTLNLAQSQQLQMATMSNNTVAPGATETQQLRVLAPVGVSVNTQSTHVLRMTGNYFLQSNIRLRLRISYNIDGRQVQDQVDFSGFPPGLTNGPS